MKLKNPLQTGLKYRLQGLMFFRLFLTVLFLGATIWSQFKDLKTALQPSLYPYYGIIVFVCLLTIIYAFLLRAVWDYRIFSYVQLFLDVSVITVVVFITGGIHSPFSFLFILSIISGSILLDKRGGIIMATISSLSYGIILDLQFYNLWPWTLELAPEISVTDANTALYNIFITIVAFYTVAFLSGSLATRLKIIEGELDATKIDYKRLESLSKNIIDNVSSGILTIDRAGRITSFNKASERITGFSLKDVYYSNIERVLPKFRDFNGRAKNPDRVIRDEIVFRRKDGREFYLGFSLSPLRDERGEENGAVLIFQDLTRLKKMEEEFRRTDRLRALGELAAGLAHEIRNPLASISGSIQVLREDLKRLTDEDRNLLDIALKETERLDSLIADFLVFASPALKKKRINLKTIADDTINLLLSRKELRRIEVVREMDDIFVSADPRQMKQVFWNLFLNAVDAIGYNGQLKVKIRCLNSDMEDSQMAEIRVSDTGRGIKESHREKIFDPFFTTKDSGTGLGLAVVHRVVEGHKGRIEVSSKDGKGTTFRILLPTQD